MVNFFCFLCYGDHRDLHVLTHSFPTRRSSDLISIGYPKAAATAAGKIFSHHADAIAEAITQIFRDEVWPAYRASGASDAELAEAIEVLKPLSIATLVTAFEHAMNAKTRETIQRPTP